MHRTCFGAKATASKSFEYFEYLTNFRILRIITLSPNNGYLENMTILNLQSLPSAEEVALAKLSSQALSAVMETSGEVQQFNVVGRDGENHPLILPASAVKLMIELLTQLGQGNSVNITPIHAELTTQEAADILNMSRPTLIKLLDAGDIPHSRKGNRRKVAFVDVMTFKQDMDKKRLASLDELTALDQELELGY